ncbi:MAG: hypothetical protein OEZ39_20190 [Gammaproteobacteria bacterium]|nr:hypothetical protein [Gammaproteobacteria bacterium]
MVVSVLLTLAVVWLVDYSSLKHSDTQSGVANKGKGYSSKYVPYDILLDMKKNNCSPIEEFFSRPGMVNAPFVYGYYTKTLVEHLSPSDLSVIYWCKDNESVKYKLYQIVLEDIDVNSVCEKQILVEEFLPGGLTIEYGKVNIKDFKYTLTKKIITINKKYTGNILVSNYDGLETRMICLDGKWIYRNFD